MGDSITYFSHNHLFFHTRYFSRQLFMRTDVGKYGTTISSYSMPFLTLACSTGSRNGVKLPSYASRQDHDHNRSIRFVLRPAVSTWHYQRRKFPSKWPSIRYEFLLILKTTSTFFPSYIIKITRIQRVNPLWARWDVLGYCNWSCCHWPVCVRAKDRHVM